MAAGTPRTPAVQNGSICSGRTLGFMTENESSMPFLSAGGAQAAVPLSMTCDDAGPVRYWNLHRYDREITSFSPLK